MKRFSFFFAFVLIAFAVSAADKFPVAEGLAPYVNNGELPGVITIIADKDGVVQFNAVGYADIESQRPMKEDTVFWIASQTKTVTAAAVMILVDEGKLSLDDPVTKYLPELNDLKVVVEKGADRTVLVPVDKPITVRMLLSHTAGLDFLTPFQGKHKIDSLSLSQVVTTVAMTPLRSQPMTEYSYSNIGISVAGAVVERVAGVPFEEFLAKRIFEPLEMKETTFFPTPDQLERLATAYAFDKEQGKLIPTQSAFLTYPPGEKGRYAEPGGGLFSTAHDFIKFYRMLLCNGELNGRRILSEAAVKEIHTKQTGSLPHTYGLCVQTLHGVYGHGGALGTESVNNLNTGRCLLFFLQVSGVEKWAEAKKKFYDIGNQP